MNDISFVGVEPSEALRAYADRKLVALADVASPTSSRLVITASRHSHSGDRFRAKIELVVRGATVIAGARQELADPYAAVDAAYDEAKRALQERSDRRGRHDRGATRRT